MLQELPLPAHPERPLPLTPTSGCDLARLTRGPWPLPSQTGWRALTCSDMGIFTCAASARTQPCALSPRGLEGGAGGGAQELRPLPATGGTSLGKRITTGVRNSQPGYKQSTQEHRPLWAGDMGVGTVV